MTNENQYIPPSIDLLNETISTSNSFSNEELEKNKWQLEEVLAHFKIDGRVCNIVKGTIVTVYEVKLALGTPSQKVISRSDDIAMNMSARSVRISTIPECLFAETLERSKYRAPQI